MVKIKDDWKNPGDDAEVIYAQQSIAASKGQKVTERAPQVAQGPIPIPPEYQ